MRFRPAVKISFQRYASFAERAPRSEFWWFLLFRLVATTLMGGMFADDGLTLAFLALFLPGVASGARRLHDVGRSGWWQLLALAPAMVLIVAGQLPDVGRSVLAQVVLIATLAAPLYLVYLWTRPGESADNRFGAPTVVMT
jgi:uncharacterized membrane protein YhaH (DUF805 family)